MTDEIQMARPRRAPWRQRLVDAETGFRLGIRTDSVLFVHLFSAITIILTALVIGLSFVEWGIVVLALGMGLSAELFHQLLVQIAAELNQQLSRAVQQRLRIGTAAAVAANLTAIVVVGIVFWGRLSAVWGS